MFTYLSTVAVLVLNVAGWTLAGFGFVAALAPRARRIDALLLAPLVGSVLLFLIGVLQLTFFLVPLTPWINVSGLIALSAGLTFIYRKPLATAWRRAPRRSLLVLAIPLLYLLIFGSLFRKEGFQLLVGSSDQLQYCQDSRHMLEHMHTGSEFDVPVPRADYYIYDNATRVLPYLKVYRRGAETLLATTSRLTGLSHEEAFPVVVLGSSYCLGLALAYLGRVTFRLRPTGVYAMQVALLSSFILLLLHAQGALALVLSIPLYLTVLGLLMHCAQRFSWRLSALAGIVLAGCIADYADPAVVGLIIPTGLIVVLRLCKGMRSLLISLAGLSVAYTTATILVPMGAYSIAGNTVVNIGVVYQSLFGGNPAAPQAAKPPLTLELFNSPTWSGLQQIMGLSSYYDTSTMNHKISLYFSDKIWLPCLILVVLGAVAAVGYLRCGFQVGSVYAALVIGWITASVIIAHSQDVLRCHRALQYVTPYMLVGLVLAASRRAGEPKGASPLSFALGTAAKVALFACVATNIYTCSRTVRYLNENDSTSDRIVLRYNERLPGWRHLHDVIEAAGPEPLLYSGFKTDTTRPLMIASALRDRPHVLGASITRYWKILGANDVPPVKSWSDYNTRLTQEEFDADVIERRVRWSVKIPELVARSKSAIVPNGHWYPEEWIDSKEMFAARRFRFKNFCDVIYRGQKALIFAPNVAGPLDKEGADDYFWPAEETGPITVVDSDHDLCELAIVHDGKAGDVAIKVGDKPYVGVAISPTALKIKVSVRRDEQVKLMLVVERPTKIRSVTWTPTPPEE